MFERVFKKCIGYIFVLLWLLTAVYAEFFPTKVIHMNETSKTNAWVFRDSLAINGRSDIGFPNIKCQITASTKLAYHSY